MGVDHSGRAASFWPPLKFSQILNALTFWGLEDPHVAVGLFLRTLISGMLPTRQSEPGRLEISEYSNAYSKAAKDRETATDVVMESDNEILLSLLIGGEW